MNGWMRNGLDDLLNSFPRSPAAVCRTRTSTSCSATLCKSFLAPSFGASSKNCGQSFPSSTSFLTLSVYKELCQPFIQYQLFQCQLPSPPLLGFTRWESRPGQLGATGAGLGARFGCCRPIAAHWNSSKDTTEKLLPDHKTVPPPGCIDFIPTIQCQACWFIQRQSCW